MTEVLSIASLDVKNSSHLSVINGGPFLNEMGIEELGTEDGYVWQTTNALLLIPKGTKSKVTPTWRPSLPRKVSSPW